MGAPVRSGARLMMALDLRILGISLAVWDLVLLAGAAASYWIFRRTAARAVDFDRPVLRYVVAVYLSAIAAQGFARAFDANGSLFPSPGTSLFGWYMNPIGAPKTLYGVIVLMPLTVWVSRFGTRLSLRRALELYTPTMFLVLAFARIGCVLQGCCFGARSERFGLSFPAGSPAYFDQVHAGLLPDEALRSLPVVPTQGIESAFLMLLAAWSWRRLSGGEIDGGVFLPSVVTYSAFRFLIEFVRADPGRGGFGALTTSQWIALAVVLFAAGLLRMERWGAFRTRLGGEGIKAVSRSPSQTDARMAEARQ